MKRIFPLLAVLASALGLGCSGVAKYKTLDNKEFARLLDDPEVQLVDVRTAAEFAAGYIPGAVNIDVQQYTFPTDCEVLDPARPVAVYCRSGVRSRKAAEILSGKGFKVYNLKDGYAGWDGEKVVPEAAEASDDEVSEGNLGHRHASDSAD